jgi:hypothetical protein
MYVQQISHYPAPGKGPELRALLEDWAKTAPARGFAHNLASQIMGPDGPNFVNGVRHQALAAFGSYPQRSQANPAFRPFNEKQRPLLGRPNQQALYEVLIPPPTQAPPPRYVYRVTRYPALGKAPALRALLEERVKAMQAKGGFYALASQMFSTEGPVYVTNIGYQDLSGLEKTLHGNQQDAAFQSFAEKAQALMGRPGKTELFEVVVPFPRA